MTKTPIVAIVGRTNVGKSSLFNAMIRQPKAVVAREAGTTRDSINELLTHKDHSFWLVDTAGLKDAEDEFESTIQEQITEAVETATMIIVVTEAGVGVNEEDRKLAKQALKSKKPVLLVVNKDDDGKTDIESYRKLGVKNILFTSATQRKGIDHLLNNIVKNIPKTREKKAKDPLTIALIGRPNVGKSYLFNTLGSKQQAIVADVAGTTRDVNTTTVMYHKKPIRILDTAGIRRSGKIGVGIEKFSVLRTLWAIEQADICMLVMDANELNTNLDQKIAGMLKDAGKGVVIVVSKWDTVDKDSFTRDALAKSIAKEFPFIAWAPLIFTSSVTGQNVSKLFEIAMQIDSQRHVEIQTAKLNSFLKKSIVRHPPAGLKNTHPRLRYITQTDTKPPTFTIFGSELTLLHWSYKRYLEREMRHEFGFDGTAIKFYFKDRDEDNGTNDK